MARRPRDHRPLKERARRLFRSRFHCAGCNRDFRGHRALNAHHMSRHASMWTSKKARAAARAMGKDVDLMRRHARGWLVAAGLRDQRGKLTDRARSRPELRGNVKLRDWRRAHKHDRDHERAGKHERKAERARNPVRRVDRHHRAANLRNRWPVLRPAPAPPARSNGHRPPPARPAPGGRLAPQRHANGTRPRTRTP